MTEDNSTKIAHLTMLQGVIARMGSNSFALKALSATFGSAAIAVMAAVNKPDIYYAVAAIVPIFIFWLMDAQYLRYEKAYRELFEHVRCGKEIDPYNMNADRFLSDAKPVLHLALTWSVGLFYLAILFSLGLAAYFLARSC